MGGEAGSRWARALARTYQHPSYADPWECVQDYHRVLEYAAVNPEHGSTRVASALELPRGRVRPWLDDAVPDCVRAIQVAESREWFPVDVESRVFRGLNVLVSWVFSGGSISRDTYAPLFSVRGADDADVLSRAMAAIGLTSELSRRFEAPRGREFRPSQHASVLGRVLHVLGAPVGAKHADREFSLPAYVEWAPVVVRREFVAVYVQNRGVQAEGASVVSFREERSQAYRRELVGLLRAVTGAAVSTSEYNIRLSAEAAAELESWPAILPE